MSVIIAVGQVAILLFWGTPLYLLFQIVLQSSIGALLLYFRSASHRKARLVVWCSMLAGWFAIHSICGQCSFLIGQFLSKGFAGGAIRCAVSLLIIPLALYFHSFKFEEYEQVPASGLTTIPIGDASIIAMWVLEVLWANADYRVTVIFLIAYVFLLLMILMAMRGMHDTLTWSLVCDFCSSGRGLPPASFRFHLTMDSFALGYILPATGRIRVFHPLERALAGRTKQKAPEIR